MIDDIVPPRPSSADAVMNEANGVVHLVEGEIKKPFHAETDGQNVPKSQIIPEGLSTPKG